MIWKVYQKLIGGTCKNNIIIMNNIRFYPYLHIFHNIYRLVSNSPTTLIAPLLLDSPPESGFYKAYHNNMDENSWVGTENVAPMVVKNSKTAGIGARNNVDSTEEYMSCQVHMRVPINIIYLSSTSLKEIFL